MSGCWDELAIFAGETALSATGVYRVVRGLRRAAELWDGAHDLRRMGRAADNADDAAQLERAANRSAGAAAQAGPELIDWLLGIGGAVAGIDGLLDLVSCVGNNVRD